MEKETNPQTSTDVEVLLSNVVGDAKTLMRVVDIFKEKDKPNALVQCRRRMRRIIWQKINNQVKEWGGRWLPSQRLWEVPLGGNMH